jgi:PAS domain S-box-containing protein
MTASIPTASIPTASIETDLSETASSETATPQQTAQLQEELAQERAVLRCLVDSIPDMIFYKDQEGIYLGCNTAFEQFLGLSASEIIGRKDVELFADDTGRVIQQQDRQVFTTGKAHRHEEWVTYPNGEMRLLDTLKTPLLGANGELLGLIGVSRDMSDRYHIEQALSRRERYLAALVEIQQRLLLFHENDEGLYNQILELLGQASEASRIYIFENHWDLSGRLMMSQCAEWCAEGITPEKDHSALQMAM